MVNDFSEEAGWRHIARHRGTGCEESILWWTCPDDGVGVAACVCGALIFGILHSDRPEPCRHGVDLMTGHIVMETFGWTCHGTVSL